MPRVYVKSFIKTYSGFLKLKYSLLEPLMENVHKQDEIDILGDKSVEEYEKNKEQEQKNFEEIFQKKNQKKYSQSHNNIVNYLIYAGLALACFAIVYFTFVDSGSSSSVAVNSGKTGIQDTAVIKENEDGLTQFYEKPDSLLLEARAIDSAWIRINIDGQRSEQLVLVPNQRIKWSAWEYFLISLDNAGAVEFRRDGELLEPFGRVGRSVRNVRITRTEVVSSASPYTEEQRRRAAQTPKKDDGPRIIRPAEMQQSVQPFREKKTTENPEQE